MRPKETPSSDPPATVDDDGSVMDLHDLGVGPAAEGTECGADEQKLAGDDIDDRAA